MVAEIQQNSDLTYRIYDFNRVSADGKPRELHLEKARGAIHAIRDCEIDAFRYAQGGKDDPECLAHCPYFKARELVVGENGRSEVAGADSFSFLLCVEGTCSLVHDGTEYPVIRGDGYFLPAGMGEYQCKGSAKLICAELGV